MGLFSNFFGGDAKKYITGSTKKANALLEEGKAAATPLIQGGYDQAIAGMQPYMEGGAAGQTMYDDLLGLNGPEARAAAQELLMSDPAFQGQLGQSQNALLRGMNARGMSGSGAGALAAERVFQQQYGDVLGRYANRGAQGMQAAGATGQFAVGRGQDLGNLEFGTRQMLANNQINKGNALASNANTGMNNLLGVAGLGVKAMGGGGLFGQKGLFG